MKIITVIWENETRMHYPVTLEKTNLTDSGSIMKYEYHTNFGNLLEYNGFLTEV